MKSMIFILLTAGIALGEPSGHWRFDGDLSPAGKASVFEKGKPPVFDADTPASNIWDGATFTAANPHNRNSLRIVNEATGEGSPMGGEVCVTQAQQPASLTIEAFVRMGRQMSRHALVASKRRNGQTGATWSLSIDPQGMIRARFDTQPGNERRRIQPVHRLDRQRR